MVGKDDQSPICGSESAKGELFCKKNHHCTGYSAPATETDSCVELFSKSALAFFLLLFLFQTEMLLTMTQVIWLKVAAAF